MVERPRRLRRRLRLRRVQDLVGEPVLERLVAAAIARRGTSGWPRQFGESAGHFRRTWMWSWCAYQGRTFAIQCASVAVDAAQFLLDRGIDQHALDVGLFGGGPDEGDVLRRPGFRIDVLPVVGDQIDRGRLLALLVAQRVVRHRHEPDIDIEAGLVARWPNGVGPPRGCAMSPTRMPFQPVALAAAGAKRSRKLHEARDDPSCDCARRA